MHLDGILPGAVTVNLSFNGMERPGWLQTNVDQSASLEHFLLIPHVFHSSLFNQVQTWPYDDLQKEKAIDELRSFAS